MEMFTMLKSNILKDRCLKATYPVEILVECYDEDSSKSVRQAARDVGLKFKRSLHFKAPYILNVTFQYESTLRVKITESAVAHTFFKHTVLK